MRPAVTYTPCPTSLREQTGDIITFAHFEEGNMSTKTRNYTESGDKSDDDSIIPPLLSKNKLMPCILEISQNMILYIRIC